MLDVTLTMCKFSSIMSLVIFYSHKRRFSFFFWLVCRSLKQSSNYTRFILQEVYKINFINYPESFKTSTLRDSWHCVVDKEKAKRKPVGLKKSLYTCSQTNKGDFVYIGERVWPPKKMTSGTYTIFENILLCRWVKQG